ncbi:tyrosine-protein kinase receptor UFO-like isoform X2 [Dysidea avara]|uniref:tyrosine-protein kinase receptor UFO-like isoform X2 n=1 Tax=Dysidea avara TaxID=196820 RepID=UPI003333E6AB
MTRVSNTPSTVNESEISAENLVIQKFKTRLGTHEIESRDLQIQEPIAEGAFGIVYKGLYRKNDETIIVAIKALKACSSVLKIEEFIEEIAVTKTFSHPNVLSLIGACLEASSSDKMPLMVIPYMLYGDVKSFLSSKRGNKIDLTELPQDLHYNILVQICLDIAKGMAYLSSMRFIHRDLSARNCMLDENMVAKVGDFGFSRDVYISDYYRLDHSALLPVKWLAPEALFDKKFLTESDVWSFGVTCWEVFTLGLQPYPTVDPHEMADYLKTGKVLEKPSLSSDEMYEIMKSCWTFTPEERPAFSLLVERIRQQLTQS